MIRKPILILLCLFLVPAATAADGEFAKKRARMVEEIRGDAEATAAETGRQRFSPEVMEAMREVRRHLFVPEEERDRAYENRPLPIGYGQTISQPYIVALMTDLANVGPGERVLEVGTGSGYQAAVLSRVAEEVFSVEIIPELHRRAEKTLAALGYDNVHAILGDGYYGLPDKAPFDAVVVTAAASHVPPPLVKQLAPGGRMVIPVGSAWLVQSLTLVEKNEDGTVTTRDILPVAFVPLTGGH